MAAVGIGGSQAKFPTLETSANFAQAAPPPPPQNVDARAMAALGGSGLQLASASSEPSSLLATWIAGPGQENQRNVAAAQALPTRAAPVPAPAAAAPVPPQQAALPPTGMGENNRVNANAPAGRSLVEYRASAINTAGSFRGLGPAGPSGVSRMPASSMQPASRMEAGTSAVSAQNQLQAQSQRETGDADSYFAAQMAAGLERYSRLQRERLGEGQRL
jgi:pyruvate/2-oxoglutarate dehydrogenase complex dihydrolipoamide acyltransferase (E2) component